MPTGEKKRIEAGTAGGWPRLVLRGRLTVADAGEFHRAAVALASAGQDVTVDCAEVERLDASALQILLALWREVERGGHHCDIVNVGEALRTDFRLTGFGGPEPVL